MHRMLLEPLQPVLFLCRLLWHTAIHYINHHSFTRASALTYTTLLAIIPTLILVHAIAGAFGILDAAVDVLPLLNDRLQLGLPVEELQPILRKAQQIGFGQLGMIGSIGLFITFVMAMENLETNINVIWNIRKNRNPLHKALLAIPFLILMGVVLASVTGFLSFLRNWLDLLLLEIPVWDSSSWKWMGSWVLFLAFHSLVLLCLFLLYKIVPYTKVNTKYAIISAVVVTLLIRLFIWFSIGLQSFFFQRMSLFYGSLAFVPLVMLLAYCIWCLILMGNTLTWRLQHWPPNPSETYQENPL